MSLKWSMSAGRYSFLVKYQRLPIKKLVKLAPNESYCSAQELKLSEFPFLPWEKT